MAKIVNKKECAEYISNLLEAASEKSGPVFSYNALDLFDRVQREGGFHLKQLETDWAGASSFVGTKRVIYLKPRSVSDNPRVDEHTANGYAVTVVNELMHHARKSGVYNDRVLARAAFSLLTADEQAENPLPTSNNEETNSKYFHPLFKLHCR